MLKYPSHIKASFAAHPHSLWATSDLEHKDDPSVYRMIGESYDGAGIYVGESVALSAPNSVRLLIMPIKD